MNIKDKLRLFHRLKNERHATVDLSLLKEKFPSHSLIPRFARCPERCAHEILYLLLDVASEEEILENRKKNAPKKTPTKKKDKDSEKGSSKTLTEQEPTTEETTETNTEVPSSDTLTEEESKGKTEAPDGESETSSDTLTEEKMETSSDTLTEEESVDDGSSDTLMKAEADEVAVETNEPDAQNPLEEEDSKKK